MDEELTQYLDERFNKVDEDIEEIKKDLGVNKINIFVGFEDAKKERARIEVKVNEIYNAVDGFIKEKLGVDLT